MAFQVFYLSVILFTLALSLYTTYYSWKRRSVTGAKTFAFYAACSSITVTGFLLMSVSPDPTTAHFWLRVRMISQFYATVCYVLFLLEYTGYSVWLSRRRVWIFFILPAISTVVFFRDLITGQVFPDWAVERQGFLYFENGQYGGVYFASLSYGLILIGIGFVLLGNHTLRARQPYRSQSLILLVVTFISVVLNLPGVLSALSKIGANPLVLSILVRNGSILWALFYYKLLDIMPVAHREILNSIDAGIIVLDPLDRIVEMNPFAAAKASAPDVIGQPSTQVFPALSPLLKRYRERNESSGEMRLNGQYFEVTISPLYRQQKIGNLVVLRDITERKQIEHEREQLISTLDSYAHTVAHDLKNPMVVIMGYATILDEDLVAAPEPIRESLRELLEASEKSIQIIDDLLLFASMRSDEDFTRHEIDMCKVVDSALAHLRQQIINRKAVVTVMDDLPPAAGYAPWIEGVWTNYISNALKYGGTPPEIEVGAETLGTKTRYWVRDNGIGINPEEQANLFKQFSRLERYRAVRGNGLGLSIVRQIVERLGGEVGVESTPGQGSTFYFTLPSRR